TPAELAAAHREFDQRFYARSRAGDPEVTCTVSAHPIVDNPPKRPLRVSFVSPDFRHHPVSDFLIRGSEHLDPRQLTTICYYDHRALDERTTRFKRAASLWRDIVNLNDEAVAEQIRADEVHILFDLAGHFAGNRLMVFARKPAPIQITWL